MVGMFVDNIQLTDSSTCNRKGFEKESTPTQDELHQPAPEIVPPNNTNQSFGLLFDRLGISANQSNDCVRSPQNKSSKRKSNNETASSESESSMVQINSHKRRTDRNYRRRRINIDKDRSRSGSTQSRKRIDSPAHLSTKRGSNSKDLKNFPVYDVRNLIDSKRRDRRQIAEKRLSIDSFGRIERNKEKKPRSRSRKRSSDDDDRLRPRDFFRDLPPDPKSYLYRPADKSFSNKERIRSGRGASSDSIISLSPRGKDIDTGRNTNKKKNKRSPIPRRINPRSHRDSSKSSIHIHSGSPSRSSSCCSIHSVVSNICSSSKSSSSSCCSDCSMISYSSPIVSNNVRRSKKLKQGRKQNRKKVKSKPPQISRRSKSIESVIISDSLSNCEEEDEYPSEILDNVSLDISSDELSMLCDTDNDILSDSQKNRLLKVLQNVKKHGGKKSHKSKKSKKSKKKKKRKKKGQTNDEDEKNDELNELNSSVVIVDKALASNLGLLDWEEGQLMEQSEVDRLRRENMKKVEEKLKKTVETTHSTDIQRTCVVESKKDDSTPKTNVSRPILRGPRTPSPLLISNDEDCTVPETDQINRLAESTNRTINDMTENEDKLALNAQSLKGPQVVGPKTPPDEPDLGSISPGYDPCNPTAESPDYVQMVLKMNQTSTVGGGSYTTNHHTTTQSSPAILNVIESRDVESESLNGPFKSKKSGLSMVDHILREASSNVDISALAKPTIDNCNEKQVSINISSDGVVDVSSFPPPSTGGSPTTSFHNLLLSKCNGQSSMNKDNDVQMTNGKENHDGIMSPCSSSPSSPDENDYDDLFDNSVVSSHSMMTNGNHTLSSNSKPQSQNFDKTANILSKSGFVVKTKSQTVNRSSMVNGDALDRDQENEIISMNSTLLRPTSKSVPSSLNGVANLSLSSNDQQKMSCLKILDHVPNNKVAEKVKQKYLEKVHRQERIVEEVKVVLKPFYSRKEISKDSYKDILRKCVPKILHSKDGSINALKIQLLVDGYVKKFKYLEKKITSNTPNKLKKSSKR